jgi:ketosteroid isomerase-like protein
MSQENVDTVRRANDAFKRGDRDAALADYHPDIECNDLAHAPDSPKRVPGLPALRTIWEQWEQAFDDLGADIEEFVDAGRHVVAMTRWRARGKGSGVAIDLYQADVYRFDGGKITAVTLGYPDKRTALEAVGLAD